MTTDERLARLERQNRWLKGGGLLGLVVLVGMAAAPADVPDVVKAKSFVVVDDDGNGCGMMSEGIVMIRNPKDHKQGVRMELGSEGNTPAVVVENKDWGMFIRAVDESSILLVNTKTNRKFFTAP